MGQPDASGQAPNWRQDMLLLNPPALLDSQPGWSTSRCPTMHRGRRRWSPGTGRWRQPFRKRWL